MEMLPQDDNFLETEIQEEKELVEVAKQKEEKMSNSYNTNSLNNSPILQLF